MKWFRTLAEVYGNLQKQTRFVFRLCGVYILALLLGCITLRLCAGTLLGYYTALALSDSLFAAIRPCVGVTTLGGLLMESVLLQGGN